MKIFHSICSGCYFDIAEWGVPLGIDVVSCGVLRGVINGEIHIYSIRQSGSKCDWDAHMYLANSR